MSWISFLDKKKRKRFWQQNTFGQFRLIIVDNIAPVHSSGM